MNSITGLVQSLIAACGRLALDFNEDDGVSSTSSVLCKSDCSHCEAIQMKENASFVINRIAKNESM